MNNRCGNCGLLNFAEASACKRCKAALDVSNGGAENNSFGGYEPQGWQPGYQNAAAWPQPAYQPQYFPTPLAPLPRASKTGSTNAILISLLGVAITIAIGIGILWKLGPNFSSTGGGGWQEYQAKDGSFTIQMPSKPIENVQSQSTPAGEIQMHMSMAVENQGGAFIAGYADYPSNFTHVSSEQLLDLASQGAVNSSGTTLLNKKNISLDGNPGVELELLPPKNMPEGGRAVTRIYWAAPRIYILFAGGPKSSETDAAMTKYFDSFKLRKKLT
ncbi:MAG TPA: zinc finger Ran-binding domain-containing protein [Pyrinomonadaceae bacterium]|nr:zinc finger Ran-binding domain-containing protein [Pyrinomonadaceae bacterium]